MSENNPGWRADLAATTERSRVGVKMRCQQVSYSRTLTWLRIAASTLSQSKAGPGSTLDGVTCQ